MLKYVISLISNLLDYIFEDVVKTDNIVVSGRFQNIGIVLSVGWEMYCVTTFEFDTGVIFFRENFGNFDARNKDKQVNVT